MMARLSAGSDPTDETQPDRACLLLWPVVPLPPARYASRFAPEDFAMRLLAVALLIAFAAPVSAADKNEEKAKDTAIALLKAVKAKDIDAVMKVTAVPFAYRDGDKPKVLKEEADVKAWVKERLDELKNADKVPTEIDRITPFSELREKIKDEADRKTLDEVIGKDGFVAFVKTPDDKTVAILVRIKDGKAKVVGIAHH